MRRLRSAFAWMLLAGGLAAQLGQVETSPRSYGGESGFGDSVELLGDINGDGYVDVAVAAPRQDSPTRAGQIEVRSGRDGSSIWVVPGNRTFGELGMGMGLVPDQNGDGVPEIAALAKAGGNQGVSYATEVRVYSGMDGTLLSGMILPDLTQDGSPRVRATVDMTNDGVPELVIGALRDPTVAVGKVIVLDLIQRQVLLEIPVGQDPAFSSALTFGIALEVAPDLNGDGVPEISVGIPNHLGHGRVEVFDGATGALRFGTNGLGGMVGQGYSLAWVPDHDGDGIDDLAAGAPQAPSVLGVSGGVVIFDGIHGVPLEVIVGPAGMTGFGASIGVHPAPPPAQAGHRLIVGGFADPASASSPQESCVVAAEFRYIPGPMASSLWKQYALPALVLRAGPTTLSVGDINGDGTHDFALGTPGVLGESATGSLHVFLGQAAALYGGGAPSVHQIVLQPTITSIPGFFSFSLWAYPPGVFTGAPYAFLVGTAQDDRPFHGGRLLVDLGESNVLITGGMPAGGVQLGATLTESPAPGVEFFIQAAVIHPTAPEGVFLSDGCRVTF